MYTCNKCNQEKLATEMAKDSSKPSGHKPYCKKCDSIRVNSNVKKVRKKAKEVITKTRLAELESKLEKLESALKKLLRDSKAL